VRLAPGNPLTRVLMITLVLEAIVFGLAVPGMVTVSGIALPLALGLGGAAILLALVAAATLRSGLGFALGWLTQLAALALGFATSTMFFMGGVFAVLWIATVVLGRRIDAAR